MGKKDHRLILNLKIVTCAVQYGDTPLIVFELGDRLYAATRQGKLNFWAWEHRHKMTEGDNVIFDKILSQGWEEDAMSKLIR